MSIRIVTSQRPQSGTDQLHENTTHGYVPAGREIRGRGRAETMLRVRHRAVALVTAALMITGFGFRAGAARADAAVASPRISVGPDVVVGEKAGAVVDVPVTLSAAGLSTVTVNFTTSNGSATANADYLITSGTLTFTPGQIRKDILVRVADDNFTEGFQSFFVSINTPGNATIARAFAMVSIVDNDNTVAAPKLFVRDAIVDEKAGTVNVPVILGGPTGQSSNTPITVHYQTSNGTATAGTDYTNTSGNLSFAAKDSVKNIPIPITDDNTPEPSERFTITLSAPTGGATIADGSGTIIIGANEATPVAQPGISVADRIVAENTGYVDVPVTLSAPGQNVVTVNFQQSNGSATANADYFFTSGTLTYAPGETTKTIRIEITDDTNPESTSLESFYVSISASTNPPANASIARATAMVSIVDNDNVVAAPKLFVRDAIVDEKAGTVNVPVILGGPAGQSSNGPVTVHYATSNGTATAGTDYTAKSGTLTFAATTPSRTSRSRSPTTTPPNRRNGSRSPSAPPPAAPPSPTAAAPSSSDPAKAPRSRNPAFPSPIGSLRRTPAMSTCPSPSPLRARTSSP